LRKYVEQTNSNADKATDFVNTSSVAMWERDN